MSRRSRGNSALGVLDAFTGGATRQCGIPSGLGWSGSPIPGLTITLPGTPGLPGSVSITPEAAFDSVSTARTAPTNTYYVDNVNGNDTTGTGATGAKFQTIDKALRAGITAGGTTLISVAWTGTPYARNQMPCFQSSIGQDTAIIATGGRITVGAFDQFTAPTADATYTNTYSYAITNVGRVLDIASTNRFGNWPELANVATAAICNVTPGSWALVSGTLYMHRADGAAVTNLNTRVIRSAGNAPLQMTVPWNLYLGGQTTADGFDFEGSPNAVLNVQISAATATVRIVAASNCSFKYGGPVTGSSQNVEVDSLGGLVYLAGCRYDAAMTDGFNIHNSKTSSAKLYALTVNCSGYDNGRAPNNSCNAWTSHDDTRGIDVCGDYWGNHGGTIASVNIAKALIAGSWVRDDLGDLAFLPTNTISPTAIYVRDTCEYWLDSVRVDMPAGSRAFQAMTVGSSIHLRNCPPTRGAKVAVGTIDTY